MRIIIEIEGAESQNVRVSRPGATASATQESGTVETGTQHPTAASDDPYAGIEAFDGGGAPAIGMLGGTLDTDESVRATQPDEHAGMSAVVNAGMAPDPTEAMMLEGELAEDAFAMDAMAVADSFDDPQ
jgi:hypothetical protein